MGFLDPPSPIVIKHKYLARKCKTYIAFIAKLINFFGAVKNETPFLQNEKRKGNLILFLKMKKISSKMDFVITFQLNKLI